jgi:hypothetical protein
MVFRAKRDPESSSFKQFRIPAFAGMTEQAIFARVSGISKKYGMSVSGLEL